MALEKTFKFDLAFGGDGTQAAVYRASVAPLVQKFIYDGDSCSILAYGQTGSGKTYTMMGKESSDSRGMIPRSIEVLKQL